MRSWPLWLLCAGPSTGVSRAQLDILTVQEAESLVEQAPEVAAALRRGDCPTFSTSYLDPLKLLVQARTQCSGATAGQLLGNFLVDRSTGSVTVGETGPPIATPEMELKRTLLVSRARDRRLSSAEAACLALAAFRGRLEVDEGDEPVSVRQLGQAVLSEIRFSIERRVRKPPMELGGLFSVDVSTAHVREDGVGVDAYSSELGRLASDLVTLRMPPALSAEDVAEIALAVPLFAERMTDQCIAAQPYYAATADEAEVGIINYCTRAQVPGGPVAYVNVRTGAVTDPKTHTALSSPESKETARRLLDGIERRRTELQREVRAKCKDAAPSGPGTAGPQPLP
jgi:hypothetical protein